MYFSGNLDASVLASMTKEQLYYYALLLLNYTDKNQKEYFFFLTLFRNSGRGSVAESFSEPRAGEMRSARWMSGARAYYFLFWLLF